MFKRIGVDEISQKNKRNFYKRKNARAYFYGIIFIIFFFFFIFFYESIDKIFFLDDIFRATVRINRIVIILLLDT